MEKDSTSDVKRKRELRLRVAMQRLGMELPQPKVKRKKSTTLVTALPVVEAAEDSTVMQQESDAKDENYDRNNEDGYNNVLHEGTVIDDGYINNSCNDDGYNNNSYDDNGSNNNDDCWNDYADDTNVCTSCDDNGYELSAYDDHYNKYDGNGCDGNNDTNNYYDNCSDDSSSIASSSNSSSSNSSDSEEENVLSVKCSVESEGSLERSEWSVAMLSIMQKHNLTNACMDDLLKLFAMTSTSTPLPPSLHMLQKGFVKFNEFTITHQCCGHCTRPIQKGQKCSSADCQAVSVCSSFLEVDLCKQLQILFSDNSFVELLQYKFNRVNNGEQTLSDIYDGCIYKERSSFFSSMYNISFTLNFDGAPKFKSSNMQIWPVHLSINELPPSERKNEHYMLLAGLWCAKEKPPCFTFLDPLVSSLKSLEQDGVEIIIPEAGTQIVKAALLCVVVDLPAKAALLNCIQFNGRNGCLTCKTPGCSVAVGRGNAHAYPFDDSAEIRTHAEHRQHAEDALRTDDIVFGVKGFSPLHDLELFDVIRCVPVDYMHCVLLGAIRKLASLWFNSTYSKEEWYIGRRLNEVDKILLQLKLPDSVNRSPRSVSERRFWKASEWKSFMFFYVPATLHGILGDKYYIHAFLLIKAMRILLADEISQTHLALAEKMIKKFCELMEQYYGLSNCGINIHLLLHLVFYVRCFGPLWTHSAFSFESQMHNYLRHSHSTHGIGKQVVTSHVMSKVLHAERQRLLKPNSGCSSTMKLQIQHFHRSPNTKPEASREYRSTSFLGKGKYYLITSTEKEDINYLMTKNNFAEITNIEARSYNKCIINRRKRICSRCYGNDKKRNNYTIAFEHDNLVKYAIIENFISIENYHLIFVTSLKILGKGPNRRFDSYITDQTKEMLFEDYLTFEEDCRMVIFSNQIINLCCNLSNNSFNLITIPVNSTETE